MPSRNSFRYLLWSLVTFSALFSLASILQAQNTPVNTESLFRISDEKTDIADLGGGHLLYRMYQQPRPVYTENGELKLREPGWSFWDSQKEMKLQKDPRGYAYSLPFKNGTAVQISAGSYEKSNTKFAPLEAKTFSKRAENSATVSEYTSLYPDVSVRFKDSTWLREKEIIIEKKPDNISQSDPFIFWETMQIPAGAEILDAGGKILAVGSKPIENNGGFSVRLSAEGTRFVVSPSLVYDASGSGSSHIDLTAKDVPEILIFDASKRTLSVGLKLDAAYLLDPQRVFPVTIDPLYYACQEGRSGGDVLSCSATDLYVRTGDADGARRDNDDLFIGYYRNAQGTNYTRRPILKFDYSLPANATINSARLKLKYNNNGFGTYSRDLNIDTYAKKIRTNWDPNTVTYSTVQGTLLTMGSAVPIKYNPNNWFEWDITTAARDWQRVPSENYGVLIEPQQAPPNPDRLHIFYSQNGGGNDGPYVELDITIGMPDLISEGSAATINATTLTQGQTVTISHNIKNAGSAPTVAGGVVRYYLEPASSAFSWTDTYKVGGENSFGTLGINGSVTKNFSYAIPSATAPGSYKLYFWIDPTFAVPESNEGNNALAWDITVTSAQPDLTKQNDSINTTSLRPGDRLDMRLEVKNEGSAGTSLGSQVYYYFEPKVSPASFSANAKKGQTDFGVLPVQNYTVQAFGYTLPASTPPGSYQLYYWIDGPQRISESDENDNIWGWWDITVQGLADLEVSNFSISDTRNRFSGDSIAVPVRINNLGAQDTANVRYQLFMRNFDTGNRYELLNVSPSSISLPKNSGQNYVFTGTIPNEIPYSGNYRVEVFMDSPNNVQESNESNNLLASTNTVFIERYYYGGGGGGGGGGGPPPAAATLPDYDSDGYADIEEKFSGTNVAGTQKAPLYDTRYLTYSSTVHDIMLGNHSGDPVNNRTGVFDFSQTDFSLGGRGIPIDFVRTYNSKITDKVNRLGNGWNFSFNAYYYQNPDTKNVEIYRGGNLVTIFTTADGGQTFTPPKGEFDELKFENSKFVYKTQNGVRYIFSKEITDNLGILEQIIDTQGNVTQLTYTTTRDIPLLTGITDASGRSITLTYGTDDLRWDKIIQLRDNINADGPRTVTYTYDANKNLTVVRQNNSYAGATQNIDKSYTYDGQNRLITYTDPRGTILYNTYDDTGRVTFQYEFNPRVDQPGTKRLIYSFEYLDGAYASAPGSTNCTVTKTFRDAVNFYSERACFDANSLKIYEENELLQGTKFEYTSAGLVSKITNANGHEMQFQYDARRRKTLEILPNTADWHTETSYTYEDAFNRVTQKQVTVTSRTDAAIPATVRTFIFTIDPANGNLTKIHDPAGAEESFTYDTYGNVKTHTDKNGAVTTYGYDDRNNYRKSETITITLPDGQNQVVLKSYNYDVYGNMTQYTSPRNKIFLSDYDLRGNLRRTVNPYGKTKEYTYDSEDHVLTSKDERGLTTNFVYDTNIPASPLSITRVSQSGNITEQKTYDFAGNQTKIIDARGKEKSFEYDDANRLTNTTEPYNTVTTTYDPAGNKILTTNLLGQKSRLLYDERNQPTEERHYTNATEYVATKNVYDGFGQIIKTIDANNRETLFEYDVMGRLAKQTDPLGGITTYAYDAAGNKTGMRSARAQADASLRNTSGQSTSFFYDELNRLTKTVNAQNKVTLSFYDTENHLVRIIERENEDASAATHVTEFEYDFLGRQTKVTDAYGKFETSTYDEVGNLKSKTDRIGRTSTYEYDDFNRLTRETDPDNNATRYGYDPAGNKVSTMTAALKTTHFEYDNANRLTKVTDPLAKIHSYTYDAANNKKSETDKLGRVTAYSYNLLNRLVNTTNPANSVTSYTYDNSGNRLTESLAGKASLFEYDALNRLKKITHPGGQTEQFGYDADSNATSKTDGANQTINFTFDALNRMTSKNLPDTTSVAYEYDQWDNLTHLSDSSGTTSYTYDFLNRQTREEKTLQGLAWKTFVVERSYYDDGQLQNLTDGAGKVFNYAYDTRGLLATVKNGTQTLATYGYTAVGKPQTLTYGNGVKTDYAYDELNRLQSLQVKNAAAASLFKQEYSYDAENNRATLLENDTRTTRYTYDELGQLTEVNYAQQGTVSYRYDTWGNRTNMTSPLERIAYSYDPNSDQLASYTTNGRLTVVVENNANGSLKKETTSRSGKNLLEVNYQWDSQNRLSDIQYKRNLPASSPLPALPDNHLAFAYDDFGNRVKKDVNGTATYYINDGLTVLNELNQNGEAQKSIVKGLEQIAEIDVSGNVTYIHTDAVGSTVLLTNSTGDVIQKYEYDAFGTMMGASGNSNNKYLFTGQEYDPESELLYYNARYYNSKLGRFISRDVFGGRLGDTLSINRYIYVKNNPLKFVDPTGNDEELIVSTILVAGIGDWASEQWQWTKKTVSDTANSAWNTTVNTANDVANKAGEIWDNSKDYLGKSFDQVVYGNYGNGEVTELGTGVQVGAGLIGVDLPLDIRDLSHDVTNWQWTWDHAGKTGLDGIGLIPVIGVLKNVDEVGALIKGTQKGLNAADNVPSKAFDTLEYIKKHGAPPPNYKGGKSFLNDGRDGGTLLPKTDAQGKEILYKEYDVDPKPSGTGQRGGERMVIGSDGSAYYTSDHYQSFSPIK